MCENRPNYLYQQNRENIFNQSFSQKKEKEKNMFKTGYKNYCESV